ncbi:hypothetical protein [Streptomyces uncialis]|uniref:hypothetical protein n=1 Tax=Streptomyces uncialis TaxID=1048205 RepID=UPI0033CD65CE
MNGHDTHFATLAEVVAAGEQSGAADSVMVLRRDGSVLYHGATARQGGRAPMASAAAALLAEQTRPCTDQEAARFWTVQRRLQAELPDHRRDVE